MNLSYMTAVSKTNDFMQKSIPECFMKIVRLSLGNLLVLRENSHKQDLKAKLKPVVIQRSETVLFKSSNLIPETSRFIVPVTHTGAFFTKTATTVHTCFEDPSSLTFFFIGE